MQYEVFYTVATQLSFSKAAEILCISQPAVSKQVKKLEGNLGVALFERKGSQIALTSSGEQLLNHLQKARVLQAEIFADVEIIKDQLKARGELKVGASTTLSLYVLPKILSSFRRNMPNIRILLVNRNSENVLKALINNEIDLAITEAHHDINAVQFERFMEDEIIPVCSSHSHLADTTIDIGQIKNLPLVMRERGSGTLSVLNREFEKIKIKPNDLNITARLGGTEALKNYLVQDTAVGFLSRLAVIKELESKELKEVNIRSFTVKRSFDFVMRKGDEPLGIVKAFIKEAKSHYNHLL